MIAIKEAYEKMFVKENEEGGALLVDRIKRGTRGSLRDLLVAVVEGEY